MHLSSPVLALLMAIRFHIARYTCFWSRVEQSHPCYFTLHTNAHTKSNLPSGSMAYGILMVTPRPAGRRNRCNPAGDTCGKYDPHAAKELEPVLQTVLGTAEDAVTASLEVEQLWADGGAGDLTMVSARRNVSEVYKGIRR